MDHWLTPAPPPRAPYLPREQFLCLHGSEVSQAPQSGRGGHPTPHSVTALLSLPYAVRMQDRAKVKIEGFGERQKGLLIPQP